MTRPQHISTRARIAIVLDPRLSKQAKSVGLVISLHLNSEGEAHVGIRAIAKLSGWSVPTVRGGVDELIECNHYRVDRAQPGRGNTHTYRAIDPGAVSLTTHGKRSKTESEKVKNQAEKVNSTLGKGQPRYTELRETELRNTTKENRATRTPFDCIEGENGSSRSAALRTLVAAIRDRDEGTEGVLRKHFIEEAGLPEAAFRTALEALQDRLAKPEPIGSEVEYVFGTLRKMVSQAQYGASEAA